MNTRDAKTPRPARNVLASFAPLLMLLAIVVVFAVASPIWRSRRLSIPIVTIDLLIARAAPIQHRAIEGRIHGGFPYKPLEGMRRGATQMDLFGETSRPRLSLGAAEAAAAASNDGSVRALHLLGISQVLLGKWEEAVDSLGRAVRTETGTETVMGAIARSNDAELLGDLSAACQARGKYEKRSDLLIAAEAAERAWTLRKTAEIAWNRAVAIESLYLMEDAVDAWRAFLELDSESEWAEEARRRFRAAQLVTDTARWSQSRLELEQFATKGDHSSVARTVAQFPQQARMWCEEELLPRWADAFGVGDQAGAAQRLAQSKAIALAIEDISGDPMLSETIAGIEGSPHVASIARGLSLYGRARVEYRKQQVAAAGVLFVAAERELKAAQSPFALMPRLFSISCDNYRGNYTSVLTNVTRTLADLGADSGRYRAATAQLWWIRGLASLWTGHPQAALQSYQEALAVFERSRETDNVLAMHELLAETFLYLGDSEQAFQHQYRSLQLLAESGRASTRRRQMLLTTAKAAVSAGARQVALLCSNRQLAEDVAPGELTLRVSGLLWRSHIQQSLENEERAAADLQSARAVAATIADDDLRLFAMSSPEFVSSFTDDATRIDAIRKAIAYARRFENRFRLSRLYVIEGVELARQGSLADARRSLSAAVAEVDSLRGSLTDEKLRSSFFGQEREPYDHLTSLFMDAGDSAAAFSAADASRARTLLDRMVRGNAGTSMATVQAVQALLTERTALVEWSVLDGRILTWVVTRTRFEVYARRIDRALLSSAAREFRDAIIGNEVDRAARLGRDLYDVVIRPWVAGAEDAATLILVPDPQLADIPFSALLDRTTGRFLIEDHAIALAPSASVFLRAARPPSSNVDSRPPAAMVFAPGRDSVSGLDPLRANRQEAAAIAALYPGASVYLGDDATRAKFVEVAPSARMIHFAGHAIGGANTFRARLLFSGVDSGLATEDIRDLDFDRTRLVVLSGCDTAKDDAADRQGTSSLARAFLSAGVPVVVATLWAAEDEPAAALMIEFHRNFRKGMSAAAAMRDAQLTAQSSPDPSRRSPSAWAAFAVFGE